MSKEKVLSQIEERLEFSKSELRKVEAMRQSAPGVSGAVEMWKGQVQTLQEKHEHIKNLPNPKTRREWLEDVIKKIESKPPGTQSSHYRVLLQDYKKQLDQLRG
jgi:hypothetical protein